MSRRERKINNDSKVMLIFGGGIILIGIAAFIISYVIYSNSYQSESKVIVGNEMVSNTSKSNTVNMISENTQEASSSIGKSVNEIESNSESNKFALNVKSNENDKTAENKNSNSEKNKNLENSIDSLNIENNSENSNIIQNDEQIENPNFAFPIEGEILKDYAKENLLYSETLDEWTTHLGIDFKAEKTQVVKASADGIIKSIKNDPRYGLTIVIEHSNGFESVYANLLSSEFVAVGEEVKQGNSIGTVGNTATFEIADETHLHFELKQDGKSVDPNIYLK